MTTPSFLERLSDRAAKAGLDLPASVQDQLQRYFNLLARWNRRMNLTALPLEPPTDETLDRLLVEPLAAVRYAPGTRIVWFDIGSGGGSPAIPMKIVLPGSRLAMVEVKARKAAFLREAVRSLELKGVQVVDRRFEELASSDVAGMADCITVRAVKQDAVMFSAAYMLLKRGGQLLVFGPEGGDTPPGFARKSAHPLAASAGSSLLILTRT